MSATAQAPGPDTRHVVVVVTRTAEDAARAASVAKEIAEEDPSLAFHHVPLAFTQSAAAVAASASGAAPLPAALATPPPAGLMPAFDASACAARLAARTRVMGRVLLAAGVLGSTQQLVRGHGAALGDGVVVVADRQSGGMGRGGNVWTSPLGCLMFTCRRRLRVASPARAPFINYLVCLAVTRGVREALQELSLPALDIRIKWPNDIYASGVKIAGALIHTTWQGSCFNVITGIGLNVNNRQPTTCLDALVEAAQQAQHGQQGRAPAAASAPAAEAAGGLDGAGGAPLVPREVVLSCILAHMEQVFDTFEEHGFAPLEPEYLATWLHGGQQLTFEDDGRGVAGSAPAAATPTPTAAAAAGDGSGGDGVRRVSLTVAGLSPSGFLLAVDGEGGRYELTPDGNSLDMMQGLVRRKIT